MNTPINPLEHQLHLKQIERDFFNSHYDHSGAHLTGWRAERQYCDMNAQAVKRNFFGLHWVLKITGISKIVLQLKRPTGAIGNSRGG